MEIIRLTILKGGATIVLLSYGKRELVLDAKLWQGIVVDTYAYQGFQGEEAEGEHARIVRAIAEPIGSLTLRELAAPAASRGEQAVILISDMTRLSPSHKLLPPLLNELNAAGIPDERMTAVVALGLHRQQTGQELRELAGDEAYRRIRVVNHSALEQDNVFVGVTKAGTPVAVNRLVVEAGLRIATGNIEPHRLAGVSGGVKALVPGVASARTIEANHALSKLGTVVPGDPHNPVHRDLEEAARMVPIHYLLNVIADHAKRVLHAVSGEPAAAHAEGVRLAMSRFVLPVEPHTYPLVIASAGGYPKDLQLYQAVKALQNADVLCAPGGHIVLAAECGELYGNGVFQYWAETVGSPARAAKLLEQRFVLGAHKLSHIAKVLERVRITLVTEAPEAAVQLLGFDPCPPERIGAVVSRLLAELELPPGSRIAVMPCGSLTFPIPVQAEQKIPINS